MMAQRELTIAALDTGTRALKGLDTSQGGACLKDGVEDGIGDLVGHFVGVAFGDGYGGEEGVFAHG